MIAKRSLSVKRVDRRRFLGLSATAAVGLAASACSGSGPGSSAGTTARSTTTTGAAARARPGLDGGGVPTTDAIAGWIEQVVARGVRRPGYEADRWTERFLLDRFRALGLHDVHREPVPVTRWEPTSWELVATPAGGEARTIDGFPLPLGRPVDGLELELAAYRDDDPGAVGGRAALVETQLIRLPATFPATGGSAPKDLSRRVYDPDGSFEGETHVLPHTTGRNEVLDPVIAAGAAAIIASVADYPGGGSAYYVPYAGKDLPVPGLWVGDADARWLRDQLGQGPVHVRLTVASTAEATTDHTIVGELPGADDELVLVSSHHDGPWASAVEDGSGLSLVLAQATYWAAQPAAKRPHRLRFVVNAGHMCGGAGLRAYIVAHADELASVVLEVHLEHASLLTEDRGGEQVAIDRCVPRWFFTSRNPQLEDAVYSAIEAEDLRRSMLVAPDGLGATPPTDGAAYHPAGVPIVQFLAAPWYLFDEADTIDKVDRRNLVPLTRATARIIAATAGVSAAAMRAGIVS